MRIEHRLACLLPPPQLTLERTGGASTKKRARPGSGPPLPPGVGGADRLGQQDVQQPQLEQQDGGQGGVGRPGGLPLGGMQGAAGGGQYGEGGGPSGPQQLLDLIQQHQQQHAAQQAAQAAQLAGLHTAPARGGTPAPEITPRSLTQHLANGLGAAGGLGQGGFTNQHIAELTSFVNQLDKRQRVGEAHGAPGSAGASGAGAAPAGAIRMLSDVADVEGLVQQYNMVREQLRLAEAKVGALPRGWLESEAAVGGAAGYDGRPRPLLPWPLALRAPERSPLPCPSWAACLAPQITTLETGVLNIKSVLTRNTDPGLIAMTGVINLLVSRAPVPREQGCMQWSRWGWGTGQHAACGAELSSGTGVQCTPGHKGSAQGTPASHMLAPLHPVVPAAPAMAGRLPRRPPRDRSVHTPRAPHSFPARLHAPCPAPCRTRWRRRNSCPS